MTETEFLQVAETTLDLIEIGIEELAERHQLDLQADRAGNVLRIALPSRAEVIVNLQTPMREIWLASRSGGFHYRWDGGYWRDTRNQSELFVVLSQVLSQETGVAMTLSHPPEDLTRFPNP